MKSSGSLKLATLLIAFFALGAAAVPGQIFGLSEKREIELGTQAAAEIEKQQPVLPDKPTRRYVNRLGQALVHKSGRSNIAYQFRVINSPQINAFALPGGFIYVNRGLIEAADNESELVGVLGHEIAHVVARHSAEQIKRAQVAGLGLGVLDLILGRGTRGQVASAAAQMVTAGTFFKFSRDMEREADRLGAKNVYDTGWEPNGMISFFEKLASLQKRQPNAVATFFSTHPNPSERADNIADLIESFPPRRDLRTDSRDFQNIKARLKRLPPAPPPRKG